MRSLQLHPPLLPKRTLAVPDSISLDFASQHVGITGNNTSGKTSVLNAIQAACNKHGLGVVRVDFNTHRQAVNLTTTVAQLLGGLRENQDIVIKFGLTPIWWRKIRSLSTGEVRKVLLAQAVAKSPDVLLLERPFDGLDVKTRLAFSKLLMEISVPSAKTARPLVQGVKWKARSAIGLCIATHRKDTELPVDRISSVLHCEHDVVRQIPLHVIPDFNLPLLDPVQLALTPMPTASAQSESASESVLEIHRLTVFPTAQDGDSALDGKEVQRPILDRVSWTVHPREVWWVQGENGSSKSSLLSVAIDADRMLTTARTQHGKREWQVVADPEEDRRRRRPPIVTCTRDVEMVSTENHIQMLENMATGNDEVTVLDLLRQECKFESDLFVVTSALGIDPNVLTREFTRLSFGEQRLVLIALAIVPRPKLLILDEPCHGLDYEHRKRVAAVVDKLCTSEHWDCACVFVTHQEDELPRSVSHRLVLSQGKVLSRGPYSGVNMYT